MIKLGLTRKDEDSKKKYCYLDTEKEMDFDGWVDSSKYMPVDYDLVYLRVINAEGQEKTRIGWASGFGYEGAKLREGDKVLYWKRKGDDFRSSRNK
jgi:hypothetical protein